MAHASAMLVESHIGVDANTAEIVAATLTTNDVDDASEVGPLLEQVEGATGFVHGRRRV